MAAVALIGLVARDAMSGRAGDAIERTTSAVVGSATPTGEGARDLAATPDGTPATGPAGTPAGTAVATPASTPAADPVTTQLPACRGEIAAAQRLARAADASYTDWNAHVSAQLGLDDGTLTPAQASARWATSRARGPADAARFTQEWAAFRAANGGCGRVGKTLLSAGGPQSSAAAPARDCVQRAVALAAVAAAGKAVNDDWAEHVAMMARKQDTAHAAYSARWRQMVKDAAPVLTAYRRAQAKVAAAPACPTA